MANNVKFWVHKGFRLSNEKIKAWVEAVAYSEIMREEDEGGLGKKSALWNWSPPPNRYVWNLERTFAPFYLVYFPFLSFFFQFFWGMHYDSVSWRDSRIKGEFNKHFSFDLWVTHTSLLMILGIFLLTTQL